MNQPEAQALVECIQTLALKAQSILAESDNVNSLSEELTLEMFKWTAKRKNNPSVLIKATATILETGKVTGMQMYNLLTICANEPAIDILATFEGFDLPKPSMQIIKDLGNGK